MTTESCSTATEAPLRLRIPTALARSIRHDWHGRHAFALLALALAATPPVLWATGAGNGLPEDAGTVSAFLGIALLGLAEIWSATEVELMVMKAEAAGDPDAHDLRRGNIPLIPYRGDFPGGVDRSVFLRCWGLLHLIFGSLDAGFVHGGLWWSVLGFAAIASGLYLLYWWSPWFKADDGEAPSPHEADANDQRHGTTAS